MSTGPEFPADFRPAPLHQQIAELVHELMYFDRAANAGKVHPNLIAFRRWCIKSAIWQLQQLQHVPPASPASTEPSP